MMGDLAAKNLLTAGPLVGVAVKPSDGQIVSQLQLLTERSLPAIEKRHGRLHPDFVQMEAIAQTILFALEMKAVHERLLADLQRERGMRGYFQRLAGEYEDRLREFETVAELVRRESLREVEEMVRSKTIADAREVIDAYKARHGGNAAAGV